MEITEINEDWEGETVLDISDPCLPDSLRDHGEIFKNPARYVIDLGEGEYLLYAEDGEFLDYIWNCF